MNRRDLLAALGASLLPLRASAKDPRAPTGYLRTNWGRDPFARGSYSYLARDAMPRHRRDLAAPVAGRLFFAGEATHPDYASTVHAALESGWLAAEALWDTDADTVAVIGAGVAGMAAAQALANEGYDVTVFEARDRVGGRIRTDRSLGLPLDLGASWVHGTTDNPLTALADDLGLRSIATDDSVVLRGGDGRRIAPQDAPDWLEDVLVVQHAFGTTPDRLNLRAYRNEDDYGGDEVVFPGGYEGILAGLTGAYGIRLRSEVAQVTLTDDAVRLTGRDGWTDKADAAVVTVPLGVLKAGRPRFDPPLPQAKRDAIAALGMGQLDKLYLRFDTAFWDRSPTWIATPDTGLPPGQFNAWLNLQKVLGAPVLMGFNGGPAAQTLAGLDDTEMLTHARRVLDRAYPV